MRHDVKFSNGDPVTATDFIYSWNRAARIHDPTFANALLGGDVASGKATEMSGLTKTDDYTIQAKLSAPAGYWYTEVALWTAWVVSKKAVDAGGGDNTWFTNPANLIGTGQFKLTARTAKASLDFDAVPNWWGGSTGTLKKVHIEVIADQKAQLTKYESGNFSMIGYAGGSLTPEDLVRYNADPSLKCSAHA